MEFIIYTGNTSLIFVMNKEEAEKIINRYKNATIRQHYVSKRYLKKWSKDGKRIYTRFNEKDEWKYLGLNDVCVINDFYRIDHIFNDAELKLLESFYINEIEPIKRTCILEISSWQREASIIYFKEYLSESDRCLVDGFASQSGEKFQSYFENIFYRIIDKFILNKDLTFLKDDVILTKFVIGLMTQYFRTNKLKAKVVQALESIVDKDIKTNINFEALWHMASRIMTITTSKQLLSLKLGLTIIFCKEHNFITSDQPVFRPNVKICDIDSNSFFLVYPISPYICIVFPTEESKIIDVSSEVVKQINSLIEEESYRFIFKYK